MSAVQLVVFLLMVVLAVADLYTKTYIYELSHDCVVLHTNMQSFNRKK